MLVIDICFVLLFILMPVFSCILLRTAGLSVFRISIPSVAVISLFIYSYIGILPLYFRWDTYRFVSEGVKDKELILQVFLYSSISIVGIIFGCFIMYCILKNNNYTSNKVIELKQEFLSNTIGFLVLICCSIVLFMYLRKLSKIALFVAIVEGAQESSGTRSEMGNSFSGKYHWYSVFIHDILNIISFSFFVCFLQMKKKRLSFVFILFIISFCLAVFTAIMSTEKGPVVFLMLGYWFVWILVRKNGYIPIKSIIFISIIILSILIIAYIFFMGSNDVLKALSSVFSRTFTGQITPAYWYLEYFPAHHDYLKGLSFPNPGHLLPYTPFRLTVEIMNWKHPDLVSRGITGSAPTVFWGEMYANFGIPGILISPFFVGILLYLIHYFLNKFRPNSFTIGIYVWLILHYQDIASTGLSGFFVDFNLVMVFIVYTVVMFFSGKGKIKITGKI